MAIYSFIAEEWASNDNDWTIAEMCRGHVQRRGV